MILFVDSTSMECSCSAVEISPQLSDEHRLQAQFWYTLNAATSALSLGVIVRSTVGRVNANSNIVRGFCQPTYGYSIYLHVYSVPCGRQKCFPYLLKVPSMSALRFISRLQINNVPNFDVSHRGVSVNGSGRIRTCDLPVMSRWLYL